MIKLILQGGGEVTGKRKTELIEEIWSGRENGGLLNVLIVPFARAKGDWHEVYKKYEKRFEDLKARGDVAFSRVSETSESFVQKIKEADCIFFVGGSEELLKECMRDIPFREFEGKVIVGSSAGTNIFSSKYFSNDRACIEEGLYRMPWNTICHFREENMAALKKLQEGGGNEEVIALQEGEFVIRTVDIYGKK